MKDLKLVKEHAILMIVFGVLLTAGPILIMMYGDCDVDLPYIGFLGSIMLCFGIADMRIYLKKIKQKKDDNI